MDRFAAWQAARLADLTAADGWLNLTDRVEVGPGPQTVGTDPDNQIVLSCGPSRLGVLWVEGPQAVSLTFDEETLAFRPHPDAGPRLEVAGLLLEIHTVDGVPALRVRDLSRPRVVRLESYPFTPEWVKEAVWEELAAPVTTTIALKGGHADAVTLTHRATFTHDGREVTLTPTHWKGGKPMFVIRDATSGQTTYAASRFLIGEDAGAGRIVLDFNRAHNPPCAFTDFAICPLPPPGNILPFAVEAGEYAP